MKKHSMTAAALALALCASLALSGCAQPAATTTAAPAPTQAAEAAASAAPTETAAAPAATTAAPAPTQAAEAATAAAPDASGFTWNGNKEIWAVVPTTNAEGLMVICNTMGKQFQDKGWTYVAKDAQGDPGKQVTFVEDAIASGKVGALMVAAMAVDMLKDVVEQATASGIIVCYLGALPKDYTINTALYTAYEITGMFAVEMAETWAAENNPPKDASTGKIPVALDVYDDIEDGQFRSNALRDRTQESDTLYIFNTSTSYGDDAQNKAYTWAENQMTANPDLRIFICYEPDAMIGVTQFLDKYAKDNGLDLKDFCVVNCYEDSTTYEIFDKASADPSSTAFKGYVTYGDTTEKTGEKLATMIQLVIDGQWPFGDVYYDTVYSHSVFGYDKTWQQGEENPALKYKY
ncbi:MAG: substrate-binding domain-containing protein [Lachnospiraceae bacterium]|jgi:ABC-type sugar transport system substrate-binding protein|nr:substrate-binding domain-containing protein [Lachnospiraceae bacterium]